MINEVGEAERLDGDLAREGSCYLVWVSGFPRVPVTVTLVASLLVLSGCGSPAGGADGTATAGPQSVSDRPAAGSTSELVDPVSFAAATAEPGRVTINVHVPFEGTIEGTDLMLAYDRMREDAGRLPPARTTPLAIYCRSGRMSALAASDLAGLGYTDIIELAGGMNAWAAARRPLLSQPVT